MIDENTQVIYFKNEVVADFRKASDIKARIVQIENLITHMFTVALKSIDSSNIAEYSIDTGQTKNSVEYRDPEIVLKQIKVLEFLKQYYINKLLPRRMRLVDQSNFRR